MHAKQALGSCDLGKVTICRKLLVVLAALCCSPAATATELTFNIGGGPQFGSDSSSGDSGDSSQINKTVGVDFSFFRHTRSPRSSIRIGASYTYMRANSDEFNEIHALSIYPELTMYPSEESWIRSIMPGSSEPFFYVRALGPSYISANRLGDRKQAENFAFQAQVGVGALVKMKDERELVIAVSWKHFSNANLFEDNDGIDLPIVLNVGVRFR